MDGLTRARAAVRRNGRMEEEQWDTGVTLIYFLPFPPQRNNLYKSYTNLWLLWSLYVALLLLLLLLHKSSCTGLYSNQLHSASSFKTKMEFQPSACSPCLELTIRPKWFDSYLDDPVPIGKTPSEAGTGMHAEEAQQDTLRGYFCNISP